MAIKVTKKELVQVVGRVQAICAGCPGGVCSCAS